MSRDIRSFFISPKNSEAKKENSEEKNSKSKEKAQSKKRTIIQYSDEDEPEEKNRSKNKKAKLSEKQKKSEKPVEVVKPESVFSKKPVKRVNSSVAKKVSKESPKKTSPRKTNKKKIIIEDDDDDEFEATINQLDTSQIEEEYLNHAKNAKKSSFFDSNNKSPKGDKNSNSNKKNDSDTKSNSTSSYKKMLEKYENTSPKSKSKTSPSKEKISSKDSSSIKEKKVTKEKTSSTSSPEKTPKKNNSNSKPKKKVNSPKFQIEVEKNNSKKNNKEKNNHDNDIIEEKIEKKKQSAKMYQSYLNRGGARNPGSKEIPERNDQCFLNMTFLITGVLDSLERDEADEIIKKYGGRIVHSVSKKLNYIVIGDQPGPSKLAKAESLDIKKLSEDDFIDLLRTLPPGPECLPTENDTKRKRNDSSINDEEETNKKSKKKKNEVQLDELSNNHIKSELTNKKSVEVDPKKTKAEDKSNDSKAEKVDKPAEKSASDKKIFISDTALVEKYRPTSIKQIIGQTGESSNAKKLQNWLNNWFKNREKNEKVAAKPKWAVKNDSGAIYKAALLSGPPGIGKTTTAYVVCAELGFEVLEFNASDTRSKRLLKDEIASILSNKTVQSFLKINKEKINKTPKHVLLMDEVDGMAGNEDRGGMQELIAFIKSTEIPIICICNDRNSPKIRSLANYTFDLRFQKPRVEQIRAAMMSIGFKEKINITTEELTRVIQSTNQDIRQVINHLAMVSAKATTSTENNSKFKNLKLGPWDVVRKVFSKDEHKSMNIHEKSDLFFHDYNIAALFVEENYLIVTPSGPKEKLLEKLADCSESLAIGDTIENNIRGRSAWGLLPVQAFFSSVIPGTVMSGFINSQINFPSWLGRNSKRSKFDRLLQELTVHSRITTGASKEAINLDYIKPLAESIIKPLADDGVEGIEEAIEVMKNYHLTREDLDSLLEVTKWPNTNDLMEDVSSKTKAAFTRAYNKNVGASFVTGAAPKKKTVRETTDDFVVDDDEEQISDDEQEDNVENDRLIKVSKTKAKALPAENKTTAKKPAKKQTKKK